MAATAEAAEMAEAAEIVEGAAIVEAEAVKLAAGAEVSKIKVARIPNPSIRSLAPIDIRGLNPAKPRNAQTAPPLERRPPLPTPNMADFWVLSTNLGAGLLVTTSARPALAARGAPRERHEDEYWAADSDATENMTQDLSNLEHYMPALTRDKVESAGGVSLPVAGCGHLRLLVDQDNDTLKGATRELALDRVAHVPNLGRHSLLSKKRLTAAFDAPMRVCPAAATFRPRF